MKQVSVTAALACAAISLLSACATAQAGKAPAASPAASASSSAAPSFYDRNLADFTVKSLDNGIKVVIKRNAVNRVLSLNLIVRGGSSLVDPAKAGLDAVGMEMLAHGSASHPYPQIQSLLYADSAAIASSSGYDYAVYGLSCIDSYLDSLLPVFASGLLEPSMDPDEFEKVRNDFLQGAQSRLADPDSYARFLGSQAIFSGGPYSGDPQGTPDSLGGLSLDDVKAWYASLMDADRMTIVAVGNYDPAKLLSELNAAFGTIPRRGGVRPAAASVNASGPLIKETHESSAGVAYIEGFFPIPGSADPDYIPFALAMSMLDNTYFNVVREKHGACYSIGTALRASGASYGILVVYKSAKPAEVKADLDEAVKVLSSGKVIMMKAPGTGDYVYADIAGRLDSYKARYINSFYGAQRTNGQVADSIARSLAYFDDPTEYLKVVDKVKAVTAADIQRVLRERFLDAPFRWVIVSDQAGLDAVDASQYPAASFKGL